MNGPTTPIVAPSPPMTTTATLAGLSELLAKATARPWRVFESDYGTDTIAIMKGNRPPLNDKGYYNRRWPEIVAWTGFDGSDVPKRYRRANAELAVAAVNALPALLARIAALEEALEPFANLLEQLPEDQRVFVQLLVCPIDDPSETDWRPKIDAARAALTLKENDCE